MAFNKKDQWTFEELVAETGMKHLQLTLTYRINIKIFNRSVTN